MTASPQWHTYTYDSKVSGPVQLAVGYAYGFTWPIGSREWMISPLATVIRGNRPGTWQVCTCKVLTTLDSLESAKCLAEEAAAARALLGWSAVSGLGVGPRESDADGQAAMIGVMPDRGTR